MPRTLDQLIDGESSHIVEVVGDDSIALRLMEMGFIDGAEVKMLGKAPLGDPIEFALQGSRLMLRVVEAARVKIEDR